MMKKEDIVEIINGYAYKEDAETPKIIEERDFENIATEIVKLFAIPVAIELVCANCNTEVEPIALGHMCPNCACDM